MITGSRMKVCLSWGIELPSDKDYVTCLCFDGLGSCVSILGWPNGQNFAGFWTAEHLVARDLPHGIFVTIL